MPSAEEIRLPAAAGKVVTRLGDTVRRPTGPWTPAVHALLRHLELVGFEGAPRVLGFDSDGREVLSFVEGEEAHHARKPALHADDALAGVARLIRGFHDAVHGFEPPPDASWQFLVGAPTSGIVCHNDIAPVNTIYRHDRPVAFIDWDFAAPAPASWDLACAAWSCVPLRPNEFCHAYGYPVQPRGPRLRLFCDAYGLDDGERDSFLETVRKRQVAMLETVRLGAEAGHPTYAAVWSRTGGQRWLDDIAYLDAHRDEWQRHLD